MLTQSQIDKALRLIRRHSHRFTPSEMDRLVSQRIRCSESTASALRRGVRAPVGKPEYKLPRKRAVTNCAKHGEVAGTYCPFCSVNAGVRGRAYKTNGESRRSNNNQRVIDPTPEEIAERAAELRAKREHDRLEVTDPGELLWNPLAVMEV